MDPIMTRWRCAVVAPDLDSTMEILHVRCAKELECWAMEAAMVCLDSI